MPQPTDEKVPQQMRPIYGEIIAITDEVCGAHLTEEYAALARKLAAALARKRPSPLQAGRVKTWAGGILYTLARVNFLFDKSQTPHLRADELCALCGVSQGTASAKAKAIEELLDIGPVDPNWYLPSKMDDNPMLWLIQVNGLITDARSASLAVQEEAFRKGFIPYVPARGRPAPS